MQGKGQNVSHFAPILHRLGHRRIDKKQHALKMLLGPREAFHLLGASVPRAFYRGSHLVPKIKKCANHFDRTARIQGDKTKSGSWVTNAHRAQVPRRTFSNLVYP